MLAAECAKRKTFISASYFNKIVGEEMLEGITITKRFRGLVALENLDFVVKEGEICGLIGPNGAGKTTLFNCISGTYPPTEGKIKFKGINITQLSPHSICNLGIARTYQIPRPFMNLSVVKNVMAGTFFGKHKSISMKEAHQKSLSVLKFAGLLANKDILARELGIKDRKLLGLARALATDPQILLLDEPVSGLNPTEVLQSMKLIRRIRDELGITIFWVEHVMRAVMNVVDRIIVLNKGKKIADESPQEIAKNEKVIEIYLGK